MKKYLSLLLSISILLSVITTLPFSVSGAETHTANIGAVSGDYEYTVADDGTAEITKYNGTANILTILSEIEGHEVAGIANHAFYGCESITKLTIPSSVETIGEYAFASCSGITNLTIPNGVKKLCFGAFANCYNLTNVKIPASVTTIESYAFQSCTDMENFEVDKNNPKYLSEDDILYTKDQSRIIVYPSKKTDKTYTMPNSVTCIEDGAFRENRKIEDVKFSENLRHIGSYAFAGCVNLKKADMPDSVDFIGQHAFGECTSLNEVKLPEKIWFLGKLAFDHCFSLKKVKIPAKVDIFEDSVFYRCFELTNIEVDENNKTYSSVDGNLYSKDKTTIYQYAIGKKDSFFSVPEGVKCIQRNAFSYCTNLTSIELPRSLTDVSEVAFNEIINLKDVYYRDIEENWEKINIDKNNPSLFDAIMHYYVFVDNIKLNKTVANVYNGKTFTLKATVSPSDATVKTILWKSSNNKIATVTQNGVVKGIKPGKVNITVVPKDNPEKSAVYTVTVKAQKAKKLTISKKSVSLSRKGKTAKIKAKLTPNNTYNKNIKVATSNKKVVKISSAKIKSGKTVKITAMKRGNAKIRFTAKDGSKRLAICKVKVKK